MLFVLKNVGKIILNFVILGGVRNILIENIL